MDLQRKMLEELMNPLIPEAKKDFTDSDVCKNYLVAFCPHEQFQNTKAGRFLLILDIGKCSLLHDQKLQKEYQKQPDKQKYPYERKFYDLLERLLADVDRTIKKQYQRLEHNSDAVYDNLDDIKEKIWILEEDIQPHLPTIIKLGESGKVAEAMKFYYQILRIQKELDSVRQSDPSHHTYRPDKRMEVCDICGALLANDATGVRIDAHMVGKQHTGYLRIKKALEDYKKKQIKEQKRRELLEEARTGRARSQPETTRRRIFQ